MWQRKQMSHPPGLIASILPMVERDYPPAKHVYQTEKALPGTRMFPDITVASLSGEILCVVEIGYTRPEKLTAYRKVHGIVDVRWYGKDGTLHGDVREKTLHLKITSTPTHEFSVYILEDMIPCHDAECIDGSTEEDAFESVETMILHDGLRAFVFSFCDKCAETWADDHRSADSKWIYESLEHGTGRDHMTAFGTRQRMTWVEAVALVKDHFRMDLVYEDGFFIDQREKMSHRHMLRLEEQREIKHWGRGS
jgi:hypothetical protein